MSIFICDVCGGEIALHEGILTWSRTNDTLSNFKLTHKNEAGGGYVCRPEENNRFQDLYTLALLSGYLAFTKYLLERWENGFILKDAEMLEKVMQQLNMHMHEKLLLLTEDED
ncbi:MAG: hypothetical protein FWC60_09710 [Firmicutes bacterium]|nr:hypothetical protein [Bacillota bacterium]